MVRQVINVTMRFDNGVAGMGAVGHIHRELLQRDT